VPKAYFWVKKGKKKEKTLKSSMMIKFSDQQKIIQNRAGGDGRIAVLVLYRSCIVFLKTIQTDEIIQSKPNCINTTFIPFN
jgi:hypothetical protein